MPDNCSWWTLSGGIGVSTQILAIQKPFGNVKWLGGLPVTDWVLEENDPGFLTSDICVHYRLGSSATGVNCMGSRYTANSNTGTRELVFPSSITATGSYSAIARAYNNLGAQIMQSDRIYFAVGTEYLADGVFTKEQLCYDDTISCSIQNAFLNAWKAIWKVESPAILLENKFKEWNIYVSTIFPFSLFYNAYNAWQSTSITTSYAPQTILTGGFSGDVSLSSSSISTLVGGFATSLRQYMAYILWFFFGIYCLIRIPKKLIG